MTGDVAFQVDLAKRDAGTNGVKRINSEANFCKERPRLAKSNPCHQCGVPFVRSPEVLGPPWCLLRPDLPGKRVVAFRQVVPRSVWLATAEIAEHIVVRKSPHLSAWNFGDNPSLTGGSLEDLIKTLAAPM